ncbi:MAG TPA: Lrp/AsnC family transcriptional regulator [Actinocrinis sp.]|nr:Lrp/AsnC family transcriptional regulator [Actinocrinis sp.]
MTAERAGDVLGLAPRIVARRWSALIGDGTARVIAATPRPAPDGVMLLRIRVLRGKLDAVARALAARDDIPMIDISVGGDQLSALLLSTPDDRNRLVFKQLPATSAVTSVEAETIVHVFSDVGGWRLDALTAEERQALTPTRPDPSALAAATRDVTLLDDTDRAIAAALAVDARMSASALSRRIGHPESTVRRRVSSLFDEGVLHTRIVVDPHRLGLRVDANIRMRVAPAHLDETGRRLAAHPAVHGALATTGPSNLYIAVWLRDLDHFYEFLTQDLAALNVDIIDTVLVGQDFKRLSPGW